MAAVKKAPTKKAPVPMKKVAVTSRIDALKNYFDRVQKEKDISYLSQESINWFYRFTKLYVRNASFQQVAAEGQPTTKMIPGQVYTYIYDAKFKDELPYWDAHPLILCTSVTDKGWYGINFHYMPPVARLVIFSVLMTTINNANYTDNLKLKMNWKKAVSFANTVGKHKELKHSIKQYLGSHVKSPIIKVNPEAWEMALFLPYSKFQKNQARYVWKQA